MSPEIKHSKGCGSSPTRKEERCFYCKREIEWKISNNRDADGNKYCAECVAKIQVLLGDTNGEE